MRALIQRVLWAKVEVQGHMVGEIGSGLVTFLGLENDDTREDVEKMMQKIVHFRVFAHPVTNKLEYSLKETDRHHLVISQFSLVADTNAGRRPSFKNAMEPLRAKEYYEHAIATSQELGVITQSGMFGADMQIAMTQDGPLSFHLVL